MLKELKEIKTGEEFVEIFKDNMVLLNKKFKGSNWKYDRNHDSSELELKYRNRMFKPKTFIKLSIGRNHIWKKSRTEISVGIRVYGSEYKKGIIIYLPNFFIY